MADSLGDAFIEVHADTKPFDRELSKEIRDSSRDAEDALDDAGKDMGATMADSITEELGRHGKDFGKSIEDSIGKETVTVKPKRVYYDVRDRRGRFARSIGDEIADEIGDALVRASGPGGPFSRIGTVISDAIGASFNVSGRSPLIALLVPLVAAIVGVVGAALQAVSVLAALLATLPALLGSIALQVGVVALAFDGMGDAMKAAFTAKDPRDLEVALRKLTPAAQDFVRSLVPLRGLFQALKFIAQENFFKAFGTSLADTLTALGPLLRGGFATTATAMGQLFAGLADFFRSKVFVEFVRDVFPATAAFLKQLGPDLVTFLTGLFALADAALPFLEDFGRLVLNALSVLGYNLLTIAQDPDFQKWLDRMSASLKDVIDFLFAFTGFVSTFLSELDKAGGAELIQELTAALVMLGAFLASPLGQKAMEGLVQFGISGIQVFTGLTIVLLSLVGAVQFMGEAIAAFLTWALTGIRDFLFMIGKAVSDFFNWLLGGSQQLINTAITNANKFATIAASLPRRILNALGDLGQRMFNAGRNALLSFIRGIRSQFPNLWSAMGEAIGIVGDFLTNSPAKEGPLSGTGAPSHRGQRLVQDFAKGILSEIPTLRDASATTTSNVVFGPNSIRMDFHGPTPTQSQARSVGNTIGTTAAGIIAARNTRLAVRAL